MIGRAWEAITNLGPTGIILCIIGGFVMALILIIVIGKK